MTTYRYRSPTALFPTGTVPHGAVTEGTTLPQRCSLQVPFPRSAIPGKHHSPTALPPTGTGPLWCHVLQVPCSMLLLPPGIASPPPPAVFPPGTAALMVPFPPDTMFYSAVPSRYHSPAVLLPPGTVASWSVPSSLHPNSTAIWIVCPTIPFSYTGSPIAVLCYTMLCYSSHLCIPALLG